MKIYSLLLHRALGTSTREQHIEWAVQLLAQGSDTPSLRILAGLNPKTERDKIESFFRKALQELGIGNAALPTNLRQVTELVWQAYEELELSAEQVVHMMANLFVKSELEDELLSIWYAIEEEMDYLQNGCGGFCYSQEELKNIDAVVKREWDLFVRASLLHPPKGFMSFCQCGFCGSFGRGRPESRLRDRIRAALPWSRHKPSFYLTCATRGRYVNRPMSAPDVRDQYFTHLEASKVHASRWN